MLPADILDYLQNHLLLANEEIDTLDIMEQTDRFDVPLIRRTARTRRKVATLTIGKKTEPVSLAPAELVKQFPSPRVKRSLKGSDEVYAWLRDGWIIREVRYHPDEKSVQAEHYRMGLTLYRYQERVKKRQHQEKLEALGHWLQACQAALNNGSPQPLQPSPVPESRQPVIQRYQELLQQLATACQSALLRQECSVLHSSLPVDWPFAKQLSFLHFLLAVGQLAATRPQFDWKEIGAVYYKEIGGSKKFDGHKEDFLAALEEILEAPAESLGLLSMGTVTPIFFSGNMQGQTARYTFGTVHATTHLAVCADTFSTTAEHLWLVESRAVLTRMAYEDHFLPATNSLLIGVDGQVRSGHRRLIQQLLTHSPSLRQVLIWTDHDEAGMTIAETLYRLVEPHPVQVKWILPHAVCHMWKAYEEAIQTFKNKGGEQEAYLGGPTQWKIRIHQPQPNR
ncbi:MAG: hypothetical protein BAA01_02190 [Bacillus thermozeamaize]|uniref:DUF2399 domain-containing protein n=1 Tax=Bacillus thermozeamaize TaxID=230954 RepID=A0A1Y3PTI3_9BACI|nr:MAG: hypothetical protein BAA01_02190 [Bacillus thermozeamaize]